MGFSFTLKHRQLFSIESPWKLPNPIQKDNMCPISDVGSWQVLCILLSAFVRRSNRLRDLVGFHAIFQEFGSNVIFVLIQFERIPRAEFLFSFGG
jgi:hypothetical protein